MSETESATRIENEQPLATIISPGPARRRRRWANARLAAIGALVVLNCAAILALKNMPTLDGPMLMYYVDAFRALLVGHTVFHSYYQLHYTAGAHVFYFYLITTLAAFMSLVAAEKVVVVLYIAWLVYAFHYLVESISPGRSFPTVLFVFPFAINICVYWAFYDFSIALATALFVCGWWLRNFDRLTLTRSAVWTALTLVLIAMHLMLTAFVLLFAGVHLSAYFVTRYLRESGGSARRAQRIVGSVLKPAAHIFAGTVLWFLFRPEGRLSREGYPFFDQPLDRLYGISVLRALSPFESRFYRGVLAIVIVAALVITVAALWKRRRSLSRRAEWAIALMPAVALAAYFIAPFWMGDGAFVPQRFALIGVFFLLASCALYRLSSRQARVVSVGLVAISLTVLAFQYRMNVSLNRTYSTMLDLPPMPNARLAAVISDDDTNDPRLTFSPHFWAGVPYVHRSGTALLNSPWLEQRDKWLKVSQRQACQFLNPNLMRGCLADVEHTPFQPDLDLLIGVSGERRDRSRPTPAETLAHAYGLTVNVYKSPNFAIYARPEIAASSSGRLAARNAAGSLE